jgi:hypothetical protein
MVPPQTRLGPQRMFSPWRPEWGNLGEFFRRHRLLGDGENDLDEAFLS